MIYNAKRHVHAHTYIYACMHMHTHTYTHTHTQTHTHTPLILLVTCYLLTRDFLQSVVEMVLAHSYAIASGSLQTIASDQTNLRV